MSWIGKRLRMVVVHGGGAGGMCVCVCEWVGGCKVSGEGDNHV